MSVGGLMPPRLVALAGGCGGLGVEVEAAGVAERETKEGFFSSDDYS